MKNLLIVSVFFLSLCLSVSHAADSLLDNKDMIKCYVGNTVVISGKLIYLDTARPMYPGSTGFHKIMYHDGKRLIKKMTNAICVIDLK